MEVPGTIPHLLEIRAKETPSKTFLYFGEQEISYKQLDELANRIANGLIALGIRKGDKVCLLMTNCAEYIYSFFGITKAGAVATPINSLLKGEEITYILNDSDAKALFIQSKFDELIQKILPQCPKLKNIIVVDTDVSPAGRKSLNELLKAAASRPPVEVTAEDVAGIIYTSGTTGRPKGVELTHRNYLVDSQQVSAAAQMTPVDRFLCILPLFHVNAQVVTTLSPMYAGASMILLEGFSPKTFLPALSHYKATAFSGVPTVYAILNNMPDAEKYDLSTLRFCICGAAPMPVEVFTTFEERYKAFILEGYGLSEGTCASSINPLGGERKIGSIGLPLKGQEMRIFDDAGKEMPPGKVGEIVVRGENVMKGYYKNPGATAETLKEGWLRTGDLGYVDEDGYFYIVGRKKEMIIRGGENIYPKEAEEVLYRHPAILEAAVVGIPDKIWGEEVMAFIIPREGASLTADEVIAYCKQHLADFKCPRKVAFAKEFPKTATGKIQKNRIVEEYVGKPKQS
ncbi:MAG: long-chain fatty acid--CoA ligase [Candidatus Abyssobacteria bacterium SURF_17]|uniref:Long-chain fatty acid--CoA ligase n=1 Tax=Candidatus Abyssobacteria bacterium SURF_17 TaxID=2093361 RepID=A0A419ER22_9BACT|nr:MAG: long-chain fatty acid--CoA ligase [Candidatus Abyssubacteria bacterium SURF_17]